MSFDRNICGTFATNTHRTWIFNSFECTDDDDDNGYDEMIVSCLLLFFSFLVHNSYFLIYSRSRMRVAFWFVENNFTEKDSWNMNALKNNFQLFKWKLHSLGQNGNHKYYTLFSNMHFTIYKLSSRVILLFFNSIWKDERYWR